MSNTITRKAVSKMTVEELGQEIREHLTAQGDESQVTGTKKELQDRVRAIRGLATEAQARDEVDDPDDNPDEHKPSEDLATVEDDHEISQAIAVRDAMVSSGLPTPSGYNAMKALSEDLAIAGNVPESYRGRPGDIFAAIMYGQEVGIKPMNSLRDVYMIEGRAAVAAHRQLGILREGGVILLDSGADQERAWMHARRTDTGEEMEVEFTFEEASLIKRKGRPLVDGDNWKNYRKDMLWARCVGRLTRRLASDLMGGGLPPYVAEEVADFSGWGTEYGSQGELILNQKRQAPMPEYRKEGPDYNWPGSWAELIARLTMNLGAEHDVIEWMRQAIQAVYQVDATRELSVAQKNVMFQKMSGVLFTIDQQGGDVVFAPDPRAVVQEAFAKYLDGQILDGPAWRVGPQEKDRAVYEPPPEVVDGEVVSETDEPAEPSSEPVSGDSFNSDLYAETIDIEFGPKGD